MGKSDPYVYRFYLDNLFDHPNFDENKIRKVGFFGFRGESNFTSMIPGEERYFYDLSLSNWDINEFPYRCEKDLDLIICTRCAYFAKDPVLMMESFYDLLKEKGIILIDWGLGDHWRFENYKVGWLKNGEQEWAYREENYLWSSLTCADKYQRDINNLDGVKEFSRNIRNFGYEDIWEAINLEVPKKIFLNDIVKIGFNFKLTSLSLWPERPQLYFLLVAIKERKDIRSI